MKPYSVLMSVYYKENPEWFATSIDSMINQTVMPDEIVIVCDGPLTQELDDVLEKYTLKQPSLFQIIRLKENVGLGKALNIGVKCCKNDLIARMDTDDISLPERCQRQLKEFDEQDIDIVGTWVEEFSLKPGDQKTIRQVPQRQVQIMRYASSRSPFNHPTVMYKKDAVERAGGYQHFYLFEDYYLWARMLKSGAKGYNIPIPLVYMRAGEEMYGRRGGVRYAKSIFKFRLWLAKNKFGSWLHFIFVSVGHVLIAVIPSRLRKWFYEKFLRKGIRDENANKSAKAN